MSGKIFVENPVILDELIESALDSPTALTSRRKKTAKVEYIDPATESADATRKKAKEAYIENSKRVESDTKKHIERHIKTVKEKTSKKFDALCNDIDAAKNLLDSIDHDIALNKEAARNKTRRQYEEWNKQVHGTIQTEIAKKLDSKDYRTLNREKCSDYEKFLDITNRKSAIFRDTIIESEYDPLEPNRRAIKADTGRLKDPTLMILQKHDDESGMLAKRKEKKKYGRDSLDVQLWAAGQIEATPYGRFNKMMGIDESAGGSPDSTNASSKISATMKSAVSFDHFNFPKDKKSLDSEMPKGKRIIGPHQDPKEPRVPRDNGAPDSSWMY